MVNGEKFSNRAQVTWWKGCQTQWSEQEYAERETQNTKIAEEYESFRGSDDLGNERGKEEIDRYQFAAEKIVDCDQNGFDLV